MKPSLKPSEPLSQVVFVHGYVQLRFQGEGFSIYNLSEIELGVAKFAKGQPGYCDALVSLIDQRVVEVSESNRHVLVLLFERGARFSVSSDHEAILGPEAFEFIGETQDLIVHQNDRQLRA